jgi:hypothetical protein
MHVYAYIEYHVARSTHDSKKCIQNFIRKTSKEKVKGDLDVER